MFAHAAGVTLRILTFKAGPEDFPYGVAYLRGSMVAALVSATLLFATVLPLALAFVMAATAVAAVAGFTRTLLRARNLANRTAQTVAALLAVGTVHALLMLPLMAQIAPELLRVMSSPETVEKMRAGQPVQLGGSPIVPLMLDAIGLWNLLVSAHIYRGATGLRFGFGLLIGLLAGFMVLFLVMLSASVAGVLLGIAR